MSEGQGTDPTGPETPDAGLAPGTVFAGLVVEGELGRGGMGVIYRARDPELDRLRALKVLAAERSTNEEFRERFRRESRQAAAIEHPNVVPVYRAGDEAGRLFLVMRLVDGPSLADLLAERGRLPLDETVAIIRQVAAGLDAAHAAGLIHRDVKPANVMLEGEAPSWHAFLGDFGISKLAAGGSDLTSTGRFVGTVDYVAPEQLEGELVDRRADVYSLACVAFHVLSGEPPFRRDTQLATMFAHANAPRPGPVPGMPSKVAEVLARGMAVRPGDRPESAGELAAELERAAGAASVAPTLDLERPPRPRTRWVVAAVIGALAAAAAVLLLILSGDDEEPAPGVTVGESVPVPKRPVGVAVGPRRVWAVSPISGTVAGIEDGEVAVEPEIGTEPAAVAVGLEAVWAVDRETDELLRLNPETAEVADHIPVEDAPADVAVGTKLIWVANAGANSVQAIAPSGAKVDRFEVPADPVALAVADGFVWVVSREGRSVLRIDEEELERAGNATELGMRPSDVAADAEGVWVIDNLEGTLTRLDPATGEVDGEPIAVGLEPRAVALGLGYVWVANGGDGTVVRVDPETGELVGDPTDVGTEAADVAIGEDDAWVADFGDSRVVELRLRAAP